MEDDTNVYNTVTNLVPVLACIKTVKFSWQNCSKLKHALKFHQQHGNNLTAANQQLCSRICFSGRVWWGDVTVGKIQYKCAKGQKNIQNPKQEKKVLKKDL